MTDCTFIVAFYTDKTGGTHLKYHQSLQAQPHVLTVCVCTHTRTTTSWAHTYARPRTYTWYLWNWQSDNYLCCSVNHVGAHFISSTYAYTCSYLITPCSRALTEKLTCSQLVKKFAAFHGIRRFITAFTSAQHLSLPWARRSSPWPQIPLPADLSQYYPPIYAWISQAVSSPSGFPAEILYTLLPSTKRATFPAHLILLDFVTRGFNALRFH